MRGLDPRIQLLSNKRMDRWVKPGDDDLGESAFMEINLEGKSVLITGASKGIGLAIAEAMAAEGCNLHIAARDEKLLQEAAARLGKEHGVRVSVHRRDLSVREEVEALGKACEDVEILVNNAGDIPPGTIEEIDAETWRKAWDLKVYGYIDLTRIIYRRMCARRNGVIINIVGGAARTPNHRYIAGCMANIALNMFTQCLGGESMRHNVRIVAINPGPTVPGRHLPHVKARAKRLLGDENRWPELHAKIPAGRPAHASEIAEAVVFLASSHAAFISGVALDVDGGHSVHRPEA